ncbi:thiamine phosphate synthase [Halioxenophilus aromaticivorans]|uniref:hydroxymethylpyrimidine kinase n=1 Tax=Halioxenophilus aromaticivorans TaxID=1306992 RepID=A0AAV3U206_9ALTE
MIDTHSYTAPQPYWPALLTISASDSAGLAGNQMDQRCAAAMGVHACSAITATTAQNSDAFLATNAVSSEALVSQIKAALVLKPRAVKIGLLASVEQITAVAHCLRGLDCPIIFDPVLATTSGKVNYSAQMLAAMHSELLPLVDVLTVNIPEVEQLLGFRLGRGGVVVAACKLQLALSQGASARDASALPWVVIKGGHLLGDYASDYCRGAGLQFSLCHAKVGTQNTRGTGCALSTFIASAKALGYETRDALVIAKMAMQAGLKNAAGVDTSVGCLRPTEFPQSHWPKLIDHRLSQAMPSQPFATCVGGNQAETLGLYPIVDSSEWLKRLLPLGITTAQLRVKHLQGQALKQEIQTAVALAKHYRCRLFINDYWQEAIAAGAYGVHLGQEDIASADLVAIAQAGLRLGVSNHCHWEMARGKTLRPSYLACGPVFATQTKAMPWVPHGLAGLRYWSQSLPGQTLVAIGGIKQSNLSAVAATGVSGVALISEITAAQNPEQATRQLMAMMPGNACLQKSVLSQPAITKTEDSVAQ